MQMWIGSLSDYNAGRLVGRWVEVSTDADDNAEAIKGALALSRDPSAEEYFIADYDAPRALVQVLGEYPGAEALADAARLLAAIAERFTDEADADAVLDAMLDGQAVADLADLADNADDWIGDHYAGEGSDLADWCEGFLEEAGTLEPIPAELRAYFDVRSYARDMELGGEVFTRRANGKLLVFWNR